MALLLVVFAGGTVRGADPAVVEAQNGRIALIERVAPAVVSIFGANAGGGGSGVLITPDGYTLTNFHVVNGAGHFMKCGLNDGELYDAVLVGLDPTGDVALVKMLGREDFPCLPLGDSDQLVLGEWVYVMGNPFLLATDFQPTVTYGIVSGLHRYQYPAGTILEYTDCIQVDASINPGNSGGPLINGRGELVGINGRASFEKRGRVNVGAAYAISINQIKHFLGALRGGRIVDHASLGAVVSSGPDGTVVVDEILEESEVYRSGLRIDDEIVSFAGRPIRSVNQFKNILGIFPDGWKVPLVFRRDNEKHEVFVRLRPLHRRSELMPRSPMQPGRPGEPLPDQPEPEQDGEHDSDEPDDGNENGDNERPGRRARRLPMHPPAAEPPEQFRHLFEARHGYANYYFNKVEQDRMLGALEALGNFAQYPGAWKLTGKIAAGAPFEFNLTDQFLSLEIGRQPYLQQLDREPQDEPPQTGGLLLAMHHLRLLLVRGRDAFTECAYVGREPLDGRGPQVDVLSTLLSGIESRWYTQAETGDFLGFDCRLSEAADPCEVRFQDFVTFDGVALPSKIVVRHAGSLFADFHVERIDLKSHPARPSDPQAE